MASSPALSPSLHHNVEFIEKYLDCVEALPLEVQLFVTRLRENDAIYQENLLRLSNYVSSYKHQRSGGPNKQNLLAKIQKCLLKSQQYGDEKLQILSQIKDLIEKRSKEVSRCVSEGENERKEEVKLPNGNINPKIKLEKTPKVANSNEKSASKQGYDKPKRNRRVRALEKMEKNERTAKVVKEEIEEEEMEQEEIEYDDDSNLSETKALDGKSRKENIQRKKDKTNNRLKEERDDKKEDRKVKEKVIAGKVTKKNKVATKFKKKKKKEKEEIPTELAVDPDEPTYCICNSISYGEMIGCDNEECEIEWFHFGCVNLTHKPKGKWYCPSCTAERKERGKK